MSQLISIATAVPEFKMHQSDVAEFMVNILNLSGRDADRIRALYHRSAIDTRYSVLPDYGSPIDERTFYPKSRDLEPFPDVADRMKTFHPNAAKLAIRSAKKAIEHLPDGLQITHVLSVTCTGLAAPGLDIELVEALNLPTSTFRSSVNFMGCYAAFHALKLADALCKADPTAVVLVDAVELCTLHFQKLNEPDHLLANSLFADGSASAIVVSDSIARDHRLKGLKIKNFHSELAFSGRKDMAWSVSPTGFLMTLSSYIPELVKSGIKPLADTALASSGLSVSEVDHWAIHPGGRKILESTASALDLPLDKLHNSFDILRKYGNMSSPTVLFVLERLWRKQLDFSRKETVFSAGFGPGLTLESMVFESTDGQ
ncbi:MAG: type III polyketide synthase [Bacteroidetes bacterium]|nr:type III polyketide synthase [Bacteroidota bacterium]